MKFKLLSLVLILGLIFCYHPSHSQIAFVNDQSWEEIKAQASASHKYIFVDAYTTWCGPCKMMDRDVYPSKKVGEFFGIKRPRMHPARRPGMLLPNNWQKIFPLKGIHP